MEEKKEEMKKVNFEDALDMTGVGKFNIRMLLVCSCTIVAMTGETNSVAYLVPASSCELNTTSGQQGLMAGMPLIGIILMSNVWGYLADTRGRKKTILIGLILGFITGCSATFAPNWIVFCLLKMLSASAMAGTFGLTNTYISECTPASKRSTFIVLFTSLFAISVGLMAALTLPVLPLSFSYYIPVLNIHFNSWRVLNLIYSLPCAVAALGMSFVNETPKFLLSIGEDKKALDILRKMYMTNTGEDGDSYKVSSILIGEDNAVSTAGGFWRSVVNQSVPLLKPPLLKNTLLLSTIFVTTYFSVTPFSVWLPYMVDMFMKSLDKGDTGLTFCQMLRSSQNDTSDVQPNDCLTSYSGMMMVLGIYTMVAVLNVLLAMVVPYLGAKRMLITIQVLAGVSALVVNFSPLWQVTGVLLMVFVMGMLNFGLLNSFSVNMFPTYVKAMGVCLTLMVGRGSAVLGVNVLKNLLTYNCETSFYFFGSISLVGALFSTLLQCDKKKKQQKVVEAL